MSLFACGTEQGLVQFEGHMRFIYTCRKKLRAADLEAGLTALVAGLMSSLILVGYVCNHSLSSHNKLHFFLVERLLALY